MMDSKPDQGIGTSSTGSTEILSDIDMNDLDDLKCVPPKFYSDTKITFFQMKLTYVKDEDIVAHFYSTMYDMNSDDTVGISIIQEKNLFVSKTIAGCDDDVVPKMEFFSAENSVAKKVSFKYNDFPENVRDEIYFQFFYKNNTGEVLGASTPFRFESSNDAMSTNIEVSDTVSVLDNGTIVVEKNDDDDFIVVRPQESFFQERIEHLTKSNNLLQYLIRKLEKELSEKDIALQRTISGLEEANKGLIDSKQTAEQLSTVLTKYDESQKIIESLNQSIDFHKTSQLTLKEQFDECKKEFNELKNNFEKSEAMKISQEDLNTILKDKEEEISLLKDMVENLKRNNSELNQKKDSLETIVEKLKNSLASLLSERRDLIGENNTKLSSIENENQSLKDRITKLESTNQKQLEEIKSLESELHNAVENYKNINSKFQVERDSYVEKEKKSLLARDKIQLELVEMKARLEQARVEYANVYQRYQLCYKKLQKSQVKRIDSINPYPQLPNYDPATSQPSTSNSSSVVDDAIDVALRKLDSEDNVKSKEEKFQFKQSTSMDEHQQLLKAIAQSSEPIDIPKEILDNFEKSFNDPEPSVPEMDENTSVKLVAGGDESKSNKETFVKIPCIMCTEVVMCRQVEGHSGQLHEMIEHLEKVHKQRMCPICSILFDARLTSSDSYFQLHISNHFNKKY